MLRASVSLSRKISRDYNSTGYTVTLDGEVPHPPDDAEAVLERVSELFHLAEEALSVEIERDQSTGQPEPKPSPSPTDHGPSRAPVRSAPLPINCPPDGNGQRPTNGSSSSPQSATPKQISFLQNLGKRKHLSRDDLNAVIARIVGSPKRTGELSKREAGLIIDHLTKLEPEAAR